MGKERVCSPSSIRLFYHLSYRPECRCTSWPSLCAMKNEVRSVQLQSYWWTTGAIAGPTILTHLHPFRSSRHFSGTAPALGRSLKVESCLAYEHEKERLDSPAEEVRETRYSPVPRRWKGQIGSPSLSRNEDSVIWNPAILFTSFSPPKKLSPFHTNLATSLLFPLSHCDLRRSVFANLKKN